MPRRHFLRWAAVSPSVLVTLFLVTGCGHSVHNAAAPPAPVATAANAPASPGAPAPTAAFQPYTLLPPPPPAPPVAAPRHRVLHLTRLHNHVYLADSDRHLYEAGRDPQGHVYPIYRDPATRVTYPLYYDARRDNLYRLARADGGRFYRNYVGEGRTRFYGSDRDYERITPSDADRPIVTASYNTYNYNTYNDGPSYGEAYPNNNGYGSRYAGYRPPLHHSSHFNPSWLWAIPVIIGAYLLLHPHHSSPPPARSGPTTVIVRQSTPITIINQISQAAPVGYRPLASPRPVYVYPPGYSPQPGYASAPGHATAAIRPHHPNVPVAAAPVVPAARAALVRPAARPALPTPVPLAARPAARTVPRPALRPFVRQASLVRRAAPEHRARPTLIRRPAALVASRPIVHHAPSVAPRIVRQSHVERPRVFTPRAEHPAPRTERRRVEATRLRPAVRPHIVGRPRVVRIPSPAVRPSVPARPRPRREPRREAVTSTPRIDHPVPRIERPASAPHRSSPPRPAAFMKRLRGYRLTTTKAYSSSETPASSKVATSRSAATARHEGLRHGSRLSHL